MATEAERERLDIIRSRIGQASTDWKFANSRPHGEHLTAVVDPFIPPLAIAKLTEDCSYHDRDLLLYARDDLDFLLGMLGRAVRKVRELQAELAERGREEKPDPVSGDFAAECAMKCDDIVFKTYLREAHGFELEDRERIAAQIRDLLKVASRGELNKDPAAASRWKDLRADFEAWRQAA